MLVGVAQVREIEFIANNPGDWMLHCHMFHHVMNFMSSMVGPMGGHTVKGCGPARARPAAWGSPPAVRHFSEAFGPSLGRSMGEQTSMERAVGNMTVMPAGRRPWHGDIPLGVRRVPGSPEGMMDMPTPWSEEQIRKLNKRETRGMRADWYTGVEGLFTVVRVLPPELYDAVMSGEGEVPPGASIPGGEPASSASGRAPPPSGLSGTVSSPPARATEALQPASAVTAASAPTRCGPARSEWPAGSGHRPGACRQSRPRPAAARAATERIPGSARRKSAGPPAPGATPPAAGGSSPSGSRRRAAPWASSRPEVLHRLEGVVVTGGDVGQALAERERHPLVLRMVPHKVRLCLPDGPLVAVENRQRNAHLDARGGEIVELVVAADDGLHCDVRDRLDALAPDHDLAAADLGQGRLDLGAAVEQIGQSGVEVQGAPAASSGRSSRGVGRNSGAPTTETRFSQLPR